MSNPMPDPQDPNSPLYQFIDAQPFSPYPNTPDSSQSHFTTRQFTPTAITNTLPIVVTIANHGFSNGQALRATRFVTFPLANATGMEQLNNKRFYVQQVTTNTFELTDVNNVPIDGRNFTPFIANGLAQFTLVGQTLPVVNPSHFPPPYFYPGFYQP